MNPYLFIFLLFIQVPVIAHGQQMEEIKDFGANPGNLQMYVHVPKAISKSNKDIPLLIALHGCSQNAKRMSEQSGWNELADRYGFIVLYPQQKYSNNISNCFNWFNSKDTQFNQGKSASIKSMLDFVKTHYPIYSEGVFVYGLSAGAAMAVTLLVNYPCDYKAGAIIAGGPYGLAKNAFNSIKVMSNPPNLSPEEWGVKIENQELVDCVPHLVVVHGKEDNTVSFRNSIELIDQWTYLHQIDTIPDEFVRPYEGNKLISRYSYQDSNALELISFYEVSEIGHALPIDPGEEDKQGGKKGLFAVDIDFFSTYYVAQDFRLIKE